MKKQSNVLKTEKDSKNILSIIFIIIVTLIESNSLLYFLDYSKDKWVLIAIVLYPLVLMNKKFVEAYNNNTNTFFDIARLTILSVISYISIFLPYLIVLNTAYIFAAIGYIAFFFVLIYCINEILPKIEWTYKKTKPNVLRFLLYFSIPMVLYAILLISCYPGLYSPDSVYVLNQAVNNGPYNNLHPIMYTLSLRLLTVVGFKFGAIMALQAFICALTYAYIAFSFEKMGLKRIFCVIGVILLSLYPLNLLYSITFWKDVPYTIGLALITLELVKIILNKEYFKSKLNISVLTFGIIITLISRHNGIAGVLFAFFIGLVIYAFKKNKGHVIRFGIILVASLVFYFGTLYGSIALLGDNFQEPEDNKFTQTAIYSLRVQGMIIVYVQHWDTMSTENKEYIDKYLDLEKVDEHLEKYEDTWGYRSSIKGYIDDDALLSNKADFNSGFMRLLKQYPIDIINAYAKTTGIVWAVPQYGYTMHSTHPHDYLILDQYENLEINFTNNLHGLKKIIQRAAASGVANAGFSALFLRPAIFMLIILLFLNFAIKKRGYIAWLITLPVIANSLGYFASIEAQDARYTYINFTVALIMIAFALMKTGKEKKTGRSQKS
ncbi:MAG: hypothetical protein KAQ68_08680 [Clostridiales bacterium]|nr:hypothetical protein [Clostridiales bacterium]